MLDHLLALHVHLAVPTPVPPIRPPQNIDAGTAAKDVIGTLLSFVLSLISPITGIIAIAAPSFGGYKFVIDYFRGAPTGHHYRHILEVGLAAAFAPTLISILPRLGGVPITISCGVPVAQGLVTSLENVTTVLLIAAPTIYGAACLVGFIVRGGIHLLHPGKGARHTEAILLDMVIFLSLFFTPVYNEVIVWILGLFGLHTGTCI